jgi:hypothetical protein
MSRQGSFPRFPLMLHLATCIGRSVCSSTARVNPMPISFLTFAALELLPRNLLELLKQVSLHSMRSGIRNED